MTLEQPGLGSDTSNGSGRERGATLLQQSHLISSIKSLMSGILRVCLVLVFETILESFMCVCVFFFLFFKRKTKRALYVSMFFLFFQFSKLVNKQTMYDISTCLI